MNLWNSQLVLCMLLKSCSLKFSYLHVRWQVKRQLIGAFTLVFEIQWIHYQYLQEIELNLDHQCNESSSYRNLALHWRQNSFPGTTLIFLAFSHWAIWRVITCSPLTLWQCFINSPKYLLYLLSKALPNTVHNVAYVDSFLLEI